jgi:hypothetical protein
MSLDLKIISEIERYKSINQYITEQAAEILPVPGEEAPSGEAPPAEAPAAEGEPKPATAEPIDVENDPDVEKIDDKGDSEEKGGDT